MCVELRWLLLLFSSFAEGTESISELKAQRKWMLNFTFTLILSALKTEDSSMVVEVPGVQQVHSKTLSTLRSITMTRHSIRWIPVPHFVIGQAPLSSQSPSLLLPTLCSLIESRWNIKGTSSLSSVPLQTLLPLMVYFSVLTSAHQH